MVKNFFCSILILATLICLPYLVFGQEKTYSTKIGNTSVDLLFSPKDPCASEIITCINKATSTIDVAMYYFTMRQIAQALLDAKKRGVYVRVVLDKSQAVEKFSKSRFLMNNGIEVKYSSGAGIMHNKFCIIDDTTLITGSFNWTGAADLKNDENLLIINSRELASKYSRYFEELWNRTRPVIYKYKDRVTLKKIISER